MINYKLIPGRVRLIILFCLQTVYFSATETNSSPAFFDGGLYEQLISEPFSEENNTMLPSEITYQNMYQNFELSPSYHIQRVAGDGIELGGVTRETPVADGIWIFSFMALIYLCVRRK